MSQASIEIRLQILAEEAKRGDYEAISKLTNISIQILEGNGFPQNTMFGFGLLKNLASYGDKVSQNALVEKIGDFALQISKDKPELAVKLFALASELGDIYAKHNLAVLFSKGEGTGRQPDKAIALFKDCYNAGDKSALEGINTVASQLLSGDEGRRAPDLQKAIELFKFAAKAGHIVALKNLGILGAWFCKGVFPCSQDILEGIKILKMAAKLGDKKALDNLVGTGVEMIKQDVEHSIKIFAYAAPHGHQDAQNNLFVLANHFLVWQKFELEADYGIQQNIPKGLRILHYLAELKNLAATEQLLQVRALKIPIHTTTGKSAPNFNLVQINSAVPYLSTQEVKKFKADRNARKLQHFIGVLNVLTQHFPAASPIQEIVCGYIPNEVSPLFFQYQRALAALDKEPQLESLGIDSEETLGDSNPVKLHASCT